MPNLSETAATPAALVAFLRGVERRGALLAQLLCGDSTLADAALAASMRAFRQAATQAPMGEWPHRFWSLLLAAPALRHAAPGGQWPPSLQALARLGTGVRAALLLRLVAGLDETAAAAALGVDPAGYRQALARAIPRGADGTPDEAAWRQLAEACQQALRQLAPERLAHLARLREQALLPAAPARTLRRVREAPRWLAHSLWGGLAACLLALAASFLLPSLWVLRRGEAGIVREPLPPAAEPAARFDPDSSLLTDPDFELATAAGTDAPPADVGFASWYAARQMAIATPVDAGATPPEAISAADDTTTEGIDAPP